MSELRHVKRIMVSLWGQRVGTIVPTGTRGETYAFQYDRKFLRSGIEISPLMMPLRKDPYVFADLPRSEYAGLPPAFSAAPWSASCLSALLTAASAPMARPTCS